MVLRRLFLRIKVKVSVFLVVRVSLTACNICQRAISQNIAHLHHQFIYMAIYFSHTIKDIYSAVMKTIKTKNKSFKALDTNSAVHCAQGWLKMTPKIKMAHFSPFLEVGFEKFFDSFM